MKYSFDWLKELSGTKMTAEKAVELLTMQSLEIDGVEKGGNSDTTFEIKVLPDRAHDAMSHVGVAREIAVLENKKMAYDFDGLKLPKKKIGTGRGLSVQIKDDKLCPRYIGAVMENVEVKESPDWMKKRLDACGMRPINNVVDATNYVMLELGQPLHAFDADKLKSQKILVRRAKEGEEINLLDKGNRKLSSEDLVITDGERPAALAGIKGARIAEIDNNTKNIILEAANFNATNIRRTRTRLGVRTESSDRFEKDIDPNLAEKAMARLIEILQHTSGGKLTEIKDVYPKKIKPWKIKLDLSYVNNLLGENVSKKEITKILKNLGIKPLSSSPLNTGERVLQCEIPTFRIDLKTQEDLIEEIGRIWGYDNIKSQPMVESVKPAETNKEASFERKVKNILVGLGLDEMYNYSFYSRLDASKCFLDEKKHYELVNPMNQDQELVRVSLIPNILKNIRENLRNFEAMNIFEIGKVYLKESNKVSERRILAMAVVQEKDKGSETFFTAKGAAENFLESLGIRNGHFASIVDAKCPRYANLGRTAEIIIEKENVGIIAEINPAVLVKYKIPKRAVVTELDIEKLLPLFQKETVYAPIGKYPTVTRDISMIVPKGGTYAQIEILARKSGGDLVKVVDLFDYYPAKNSMAIRIFMSSKDRTLESAEVDAAMEKIISNLEKGLGVEVRK